MKKSNLRIIGIEESEESQRKEPENIFNKIIVESFPNLNKDIAINSQEAYRTPNRLDQKKILLSYNDQNIKCTEQRKNIKSCKSKKPSNI